MRIKLQAERCERLELELNAVLERSKRPNVINAFNKGIGDLEELVPNVVKAFNKGIKVLEELVRLEAKAAREDAELAEKCRIDGLSETDNLRKQLHEEKKKVEELEDKIKWLNQELNNKQTALMEAESAQQAAERVVSPEEKSLKEEVDELVSKLDEQIKTVIPNKEKTIKMIQDIIDANQDEEDVKHQRDTALPHAQKMLEKEKTKRGETQVALDRKQDELDAVRNCPVCIRRKSNGSVSSGSSSVDSGIGMSSVGSGRGPGTLLPCVPEKYLEDNT